MNELPDDALSYKKYSLIAPCIEQGMSVKQRSIETGIHRSTLTRLRNLFRSGGFSALERKQRSDKGRSEVGCDLSELIKAHLIALPHQSCATIQRMITRICSKQGWRAPSYSAVRRIYKNLPRDLLTLSKDSAEYKRLYEIPKALAPLH